MSFHTLLVPSRQEGHELEPHGRWNQDALSCWLKSPVFKGLSALVLIQVWQHVANKLGVYIAAKVAIVCTAQDGALCSVGLQHYYEPLHPDHKDRVCTCHTPVATKGKAQELGFSSGASLFLMPNFH